MSTVNTNMDEELQINGELTVRDVLGVQQSITSVVCLKENSKLKMGDYVPILGIVGMIFNMGDELLVDGATEPGMYQVESKVLTGHQFALLDGRMKQKILKHTKEQYKSYLDYQHLDISSLGQQVLDEMYKDGKMRSESLEEQLKSHEMITAAQ